MERLDHFYISSVNHLAAIPLQIIFFYKDIRLYLQLTTLMGLINHSIYIRGRVLSALDQKLKILEFYFTTEEIDDPAWLLWLGGSKTSRPNFKNINLMKFIAFSHCYMFQQSFINCIINFKHVSIKKPSLFKTIFYSKKVLGWNEIANELWTVTLGFHALHIPESRLKRYVYFKKFVRNAIRSSDRFSKAKVFHDPFLGSSFCRYSRNCIICHLQVSAGVNPLALPPPSYKHHTRKHPCPSLMCTPYYISNKYRIQL